MVAEPRRSGTAILVGDSLVKKAVREVSQIDSTLSALGSLREKLKVAGRGSAVKLLDGLAGESPASAGYPVGTVVISGDGAGDPTVGSPDVNVLDGWMQVWSAPTGGQAKQQVVAQANRSQASKTYTSPESECEDEGNAELLSQVEGRSFR